MSSTGSPRQQQRLGHLVGRAADVADTLHRRQREVQQRDTRRRRGEVAPRTDVGIADRDPALGRSGCLPSSAIGAHRIVPAATAAGARTVKRRSIRWFASRERESLRRHRGPAGGELQAHRARRRIRRAVDQRHDEHLRRGRPSRQGSSCGRELHVHPRHDLDRITHLATRLVVPAKGALAPDPRRRERWRGKPRNHFAHLEGQSPLGRSPPTSRTGCPGEPRAGSRAA